MSKLPKNLHGRTKQIPSLWNLSILRYNHNKDSKYNAFAAPICIIDSRQKHTILRLLDLIEKRMCKKVHLYHSN